MSVSVPVCLCLFASLSAFLCLCFFLARSVSVSVCLCLSLPPPTPFTLSAFCCLPLSCYVGVSLSCCFRFVFVFVSQSLCHSCPGSDRLVGLVVRRPPRDRKIPGSNPACAGIFSGSSHTSDLKTGTPVATLPGAWRYRVSTGTGRPGVSIL